MPKKKQPTSKEIRASRVRDWSEILHESSIGSMFPGGSEEEQDKRLTFALIQWAEEEDDYTIEAFCRKMRMTYREFESKLEQKIKWPILKKWYPEVLRWLADKRYKAALTRKVDKEMAMLGISRMSLKYRQDMLEASEIKKASTHENKEGGTVFLSFKDPEVITNKELQEENEKLKSKRSESE